MAEPSLNFRRGRIVSMLCKKIELKKLKPSELDLPNGTKLYVNERLCR